MESRVGAISLMQSDQKIQYLARRIFCETYANEFLIGQGAPGKGHLSTPSRRYDPRPLGRVARPARPHGELLPQLAKLGLRFGQTLRYHFSASAFLTP